MDKNPPTAGTSRTVAIATDDGIVHSAQMHDGDGCPLVFGHGSGQTRSAWQAAAVSLAERGQPGLAADARCHRAQPHQQRIVEAARQIRCPVLLLRGGRSDLVSEHTIKEFLERVPHAHHVQLPQATHMLAADDNPAFTTTVMQYLDTLPAHATDGLSATSYLTGALQ